MKDKYDLSTGVRGAVCPMPPGHTRMTLRMDDTVMEWFREKVHRAGGGDYQRLINDALREHIRRQEPIEAMVRRVVREELGRVALARGRTQCRRRRGDKGTLRKIRSRRQR